ncbi:hypothetical protein D3C71_89220 [compost metagenome]
MEQVKIEEGLLKRITFRMSNEEWEKLEKMLKRSRHRSMSELIRAMLFRGKVLVVSHDDSLDLTMEQLSAIRTELHRIGVNVNQLTAKFHSEPMTEGRLLQVKEIQDEFKEMGKKVEELMRIIKKLSYRWLPE